MVWRGVYRSGFPTKKNLAFLQQLGLRSILILLEHGAPVVGHLERIPEQIAAQRLRDGVGLLGARRGDLVPG